jgi:hypothetical protein
VTARSDTCVEARRDGTARAFHFRGRRWRLVGEYDTWDEALEATARIRRTIPHEPPNPVGLPDFDNFL